MLIKTFDAYVGQPKSRRRGIYQVVSDSHNNDRVQRLDPRTGTFVEYLLPLPRDAAVGRVNVRRVFVDNSTNPVTFWVGNNHGASIIKLKPGD